MDNFDENKNTEISENNEKQEEKQEEKQYTDSSVYVNEFKKPHNPLPPKNNKSNFAIMFLAVCIVLCGLGFAVGAYFMSEKKTVYVNETSYKVSENDKSESEQSTDDKSTADNSKANEIDDRSQIEEISSTPSKTYYDLIDAVKLTADSVVEIRTEQVEQGSFMRQYITSGAGSGVIISEDGYIVTNDHVVEGATTILVTLRNGKSYDATVVGTDSESDIAILKIEGSGFFACSIGTSSSLQVGQTIIAIGNPLGTLGGTVTEGIISALEREISVEGEMMTLLQISAAISPGNSGGGLFDLAGNLVGIVNSGSASDEAENLGFAIPIDSVLSVINDLKLYGYVTGRTNFGVTAVDIYSSYYAYYYGVPEYGTYVYSTDKNSDSYNAGISSGDRIDSVNGTAITSLDVLEEITDSFEIGDTVTVVVTRFTTSGRKTTSEQLTFEITITEYKPN